MYPTHSSINKENLLKLIENPIFRQMLDSLSSGICITDISGTIIYFSKKCYDIYGLDSSQSVEGKKIDDLFLTGKAGVLRTLKNSRLCKINSMLYNGIEGIARRYPILDKEGKLLGCLSEALTTTHDLRLGELLHDFQQLKQLLIQKNANTNLEAFESIVGTSQIMQRTKDMGKRFAQSDEPVLITGESGTGKELFAQAIHKASPRAGGPFISVNCAALPRDLAESELFGYVEGAFTGSRKGGQKGLFESAHRGTILLDEIGELPLSIQAKLLRVLESKEIQKIGMRSRNFSDFRLIAATNRHLQTQIKKHLFREDLYHRLNILELKLPPLREHLEDIPILITQLTTVICGAQNALCLRISPDVLKLFNSYRWPGNIRELKNVLTYAYCGLEKNGGMITPQHLPERLLENLLIAPPCSDASSTFSFQDIKEHSETQGIVTALNIACGNKTKAARLLGISRNTLYLKMKKLGIAGL